MRFKLPSNVQVGLVDMRLTIRGQQQHGAQFVRLEGDHTPQEALEAGAAWGEAGKKLPDWIEFAGGLAGVEPRQSQSVVQRLQPGTYFLLDVEGEDENISETFEVTGQAGGAQLPEAQGTVKAAEYTLNAVGARPGTTRVVFENIGDEPHHMLGAPIQEGKTIADVRAFLRDHSGEPPIDEERDFETAIVAGGDAQVVSLDLQPGKYALVCFIPDRAGGPPHAAKGMISELVVPEAQ